MAFTQIRPIIEIFYPFEMAVTMSAKQNVRSAHSVGVVAHEELGQLSLQDQQRYIADARDLLRKIGKNYVPLYPETERVCVEGFEPPKVTYGPNAIHHAGDHRHTVAADI